MKRTKASTEELVVETARRLLTKGIGNRGILKKNNKSGFEFLGVNFTRDGVFLNEIVAA